ncbi:hypothetical protein GGX14DRAFT_312589, partial [Mycena pura]
SVPIPMPAQECSVHPPILMAAIPVEAVMPSVRCISRRCLMISRSSTDLPVPAEPEKKVFFPRRTLSRTKLCSPE